MTSEFVPPTVLRQVASTINNIFGEIPDDVPRTLALSGLYHQALEQIADGHPEPAAAAGAALGRS